MMISVSRPGSLPLLGTEVTRTSKHPCAQSAKGVHRGPAPAESWCRAQLATSSGNLEASLDHVLRTQLAYSDAQKLQPRSMHIDNVAERLRRKTRNLIPKGSQVRVLPLSVFLQMPSRFWFCCCRR